MQFSSLLFSDQYLVTFSSDKSESMNLVQFVKENQIPLQLFYNHTYIGKLLFVPSCCLHILFVVPSKLFYKFPLSSADFPELALDFPLKTEK